MTAGLADATIDWAGILDYYEGVVRTMGGLETVREFFRLYLLPGQDHGCDGVASSGYWDRQLDAFMDWVENGGEPKILIAGSCRFVKSGQVRFGVRYAPRPDESSK